MQVRIRHSVGAVLASVFLTTILAQYASAVPIVFTIDPSLSSITLTGTFSGIPLMEQGMGSTVTSYSGTITVDLDDPLAPGTIEPLSSSAVAAVSGMWLPESGGGPSAGDPGTAEDANYGLFLDAGALGVAFAAARDIVFDISGPVEAVAAGSFASSQTFTTSSGIFDVNAPAVFGGPSSDDLTGDSRLNGAAASSYSVSGTTATLTIPVDMEDMGDLSVFFDGVIVATATVPEPSGMMLGLTLAVGALTFSRRRRENR